MVVGLYDNVTDFIDKVNREPMMKYIYTQGGCYTFYLMLKSVFPGATPYISEEKDHIRVKIGYSKYDIKGRHRFNKGYTEMTEEEIQVAEKWQFSKSKVLQIAECPYCEEPICAEDLIK